MEPYYTNEILWINPKLGNLLTHAFPSQKIWVTLNLIFSTIIKQELYDCFRLLWQNICHLKNKCY